MAALSTILVLSIIWLVNVCASSKSIKDHWKPSICEVTEIIGGRTSNLVVSYWAKSPITGKDTLFADRFSGDYSPTPVLGELFTMKYDSINPEEFYVELWRPLFLTDEIIEKTKSTITRNPYRYSFFGDKKIASTHAVDYRYMVNGKNYTRTQDLPPNFIQDNTVSIHKNDKFFVAYLVENPKRSILILDSTGRNYPYRMKVK